MQALEPRVLLTATPFGTEFQVNNYTTDVQGSVNQLGSRTVATDANGNFVVTWSSNYQDGDSYGIFAERYNAAGVRQGSVFQVNTYTTGRQSYSAVAMDADGDFVVTWTSYGGMNTQDGSGDGIYAQRYNSSGVAQGSEFRVNSYTTGTQRWSAVAIDAAGNFVITWESYAQDGSNNGVYGQRYNAAGVAQGGEFLVNTYTTSGQQLAAVAMDVDGDFVVTWQSNGQDGSQYGVYGQRFNASGVAQGSEFLVNTYTTSVQRSASVAMDSAGDFVVTWQSYAQDGSKYGIYGQRFNAAGTKQGSEFRVNTYTTNHQRSAQTSMDANGNFIVTWESYGGQDGDKSGIYAQKYTAAGVAQGTEFQVNVFTSNAQTLPAVAMDADGDFVVTWTSVAQDGSVEGVIARQYREVANPAASAPVVFSAGGVVTENERLTSAPTSLTVAFSQDLSITGGAAGANSVTNPANWLLTLGGVDVSNLITGVTFGSNASTGKFDAVLTFSAALTNGTYVLTPKATIQDTSGNSYDGDFNSTPGGLFTRTFRVATTIAVGSETRVNTTTTAAQAKPAIATDASGNYVVAWQSNNQDGNGYGVYAQRYNNQGVAQGTEFRVNTYTTADQKNVSVAMDADGDFVVTWQSALQDGSADGIYAQRYNASGAAQGSEFRVNSFTTGSQTFLEAALGTTVAMDATGNFVITWQSNGQDGSLYGIYAQRYNANGVAQGSEVRVNTSTTNSQSSPTVAMDATANYVIVWAGEGISANVADEIFGQRFSAAGVAQGGEFLVNSHTASAKGQPTVAMDADGDFVIAWTALNQGEAMGYNVFAQRYDKVGALQGTEFLVNTYTTGGQFLPTVSMDADGDFVIAWVSNNQNPGNPGDYDLFAQRYNAAGVKQGLEFAVNTFTTGNQSLPAVAMDADGDFVIAWDSYSQDGDHFGVYSQRFKGNSSPAITSGQSFTINENRAAGFNVGTVVASDPDPGDTLTYAITAGNTGTAFAINATTGKITVNSVAPLNFELNPTFTLTVTATDQLLAVDTKTVTVNLNNLNEAPFAFSKSFRMSENRPVGYVVGNITTTDQDAGQTLTYSITGGNTGSAFAINAMTGQITVNTVAPVDFELNPVFNLQITATDNGAPQNSRVGLAVINLMNLNEKPRFVNQTIGNIAENSPNGTVVGVVRAVDQDAGQTLTYAITGGNPNNAFAINGMTGQVTVNNATALDFETTPTFNLQITATDNGSPQQSSMATAVINLIDVPGAIRNPRQTAPRSAAPSFASSFAATAVEQTLIAEDDASTDPSDEAWDASGSDEPYRFLLTDVEENDEAAATSEE